MEQRSLPNATASLVLGILSIPGCCFYGVLGLILGIIAVVLGKKAKKIYAEAENPEIYTGIGNAKAGYVTGIIGIVLSAIYLAMVLFIIATVGWAAAQDPSYWQEVFK